MELRRFNAIRRMAVVGICALALMILPGTPVWATARAIGARTIAFVGRTVAPAFGMRAASPPPPSMGATMTTALATDTDGDGKADPGDVIRYTTTISNSGTDATGVHLYDAIDAHTTLVGGSVVISPLAFNDTYTSVGNMTLDTSTIAANCAGNSLFGVLCNDTLNGATVAAFGDTSGHAGDTVVNGTNTVTTAHGTVVLKTDGSFVYNPAAGYEGTDTFWYTAANTTITPSLTDTGQVTITIGGANGMVWFVNSTGAAGTGTQASPFSSLSGFAAVNNGAGSNPTFGDTIYLFENATTYTGPLTLLQNQRFIGQDTTLSPSALNGPAAQPGNAYPPINPDAGTKVTIASSSTSSAAVTAASGTTLAGFTAGTTGASQYAISATNGSLSVRDVTINSPAGGLSLTQTAVVGTAPFTGFTSVTSTGGISGIRLFGASGTLALGTGALSGASGATVDVAGGSATVSYGGSITQNETSSSVLNVVTLSGVRNTSTMTFSGAVSVSSLIGMQFNGADGSYTFSSPVTMTGAAQITLSNGCNGSFNFTNTGTSITNPGGAAISVNGGSGSFDYNGTISKTNDGVAINILNKTGGTVSFDGLVSATGSADGINLQTNTGATFAFTGGLTLDTSASGTTAFTAAGGGTVTVTGTSNTITSGNGTALNVANTTIGSGNLTFHSVSAGTAASGPANGIILNSTGSSGGLRVTGDGAPSRNGSGGTIQHTGGDGVSLTSTRGVQLSRMNINNAGNNGVFGSAVNGFVSDWNSLTGNGNAVNEGGIRFGGTLDTDSTGLTGGAIGSATETRIDHTLINTSFEHGLVVENTSGTLTQLNLTGTTIQNDGNGSGFLIETRGTSGSTAAATVQLEGSSFLNNPGAGVAGNALRDTTLTMNILGNAAPGANTFTGHDTILLGNGDTGHLVADIRNNTITGNGNGIFVGNAVSATSGATLSAKIVNNDVTTNVGGANHSISSFMSGGASHLLIDSNTVVNNGQANGINIGTPDDPSGPNFTAKVINNTVTGGATAANGISLAADVSGPGATAAFEVDSNTVNWSASNINNLDGIFLNQFGSSTVSLERGGSASNSAATVLAANNPNAHASAGGAATEVSGTVTVVNNGTITLPLLAAAGGVARPSTHPSAAPASTAVLTESALDRIVPGALGRWAGVGLPTTQADAMRHLDWRVQVLAGREIGGADRAGEISLGESAAGYGWYADQTPDDDLEFGRRASATRLYTRPQGVPAGRLDLLTAVLHEMGHELGLPDSYAEADRDSLMYGRLTTGERRLPSAGLLTALASSPTGVLRQALSLFRAPDRRVRHQSQDVVGRSRGSSAANGLLRGPSVESHGSQTPTLAMRASSRLKAWRAAAVSATRAVLRDVRVLAMQAVSSVVAPLHASGETVDLDLGTVPAGKTLTVVFRVTVDTPPVASYANHATISSTTASFSSTDTNTVTTTGDLYNTSTALVSSLNPADVGIAVTFTATVTPTEGSGLTPIGNVQFKDGASSIGSPVACADAGGFTCSAQLTTSSLTGALPTLTHSITAEYLGGTSHDASTSNTVSQDIVACVANPVVINNNDSGAGSLRQALAEACGTAGSNLVTFNTSSVLSPITLTTGELVPARDVTVQWTGATALEVTRGSGDFRIFHVTAGRTVTIEKLKLTNGNLNVFSLSGKGGGILNEGSLTILNSVVSGNKVAGKGGGIANSALTAGTTATLTIQDTTVSSNETTYVGGGLVNEAGDPSSTASITIRNSLVALNVADTAGGVFNDGATGTVQLTVSNATISGNVAGGDTGGLYNTGTATLTSATVTANVSNTLAFAFQLPGGINAPVGSLTLRNTIVAGNIQTGVGPDDIHGAADPVSASNLIGEGSHLTGITDGSNGNQIGTTASPIDPKLAPLAGNGGPTLTHALLPGSPAIDAGDNALVVGTTDQRGTNFGRIKDGPDADAIATVDIGAFELDPSISDITDKTTNEDTPMSFSFDVGDSATGSFADIVATSSDQAVATNAGLVVTGTGSTRTLTITPAPNGFGTASITVTVSKQLGSVTLDASDTFLLTVNPVNDAPTIDAIGSPAPIGEDSAQQTVNLAGISAGGGESQTLIVTATSDNHAVIPDPAVTYTSANASGSLSYTPVANAYGTATITVTVFDGGDTLNGGVNTTQRTFTVTVDPRGDTPSVTNATTTEDTQTSSGLTITKNAVDGASVTEFKITNIQHGTLYLPNGSTVIASGGFVDISDAAIGLRFTPAANFTGTASFDVQASAGGLGNTGLGGAVVTATITVTPVADTPSVTPATTLAQVQTTSGLVITPNAADGPEVTHFKITGINSNGALYQHDGTTPIANNEFITVAQGAAGLKYTPATGFAGTAAFFVQASLSNTDSGLGGGGATGSITVNKHATTTAIVSDAPDPSDKTQPFKVVYTVTTAGAGPAPTGNVVVSISGGSETCTGTAAAGQCLLTPSPTITGARQITATYQGDSVTLSSTSATAPHTVLDCTIDPIVTVTDDSGAGSLRAALAAACYGSTITFNIAAADPHTITLATPLTIVKNMTVAGSADGIVISGNDATPIFGVGLGVTAAALNRLTLTAGYREFGGGAVQNLGTLTIADSTLSQNHSAHYGGAIANFGIMTIVGSTLTGNTAAAGGGAIWSAGSDDLTVLNSTISGNTAGTDFGGGISSTGNPIALIHVTITGNSSDRGFGGLALFAGTIANSIIAGNTSADGAPDLPGNGVRLGGNVLGGDPMLSPLQNNGGPTLTHRPLPGSPALDIGENQIATDAGLTTDQRGAGFARVRDAADADTTQTVDAGAVEVDPDVELLTDKTIDEDGSVQFTFNVGDAATAFDSITVLSGNVTLLPNLGANIDLAGTGSTRTLTLTPAANLSGTSVVTVTVTKAGGSSSTSFTLTVNSVNDPPTLNPIASPAAIPEDSPLQTVNLGGITAGGGEVQLVTVTASSDNTGLIPTPAVSYANPSLTGSLTYTPVPGASGIAHITVTVTDADGAPAVQTFTVTVNSVADAPSVNSVHAIEDAGSDVIHITKNPTDGPDVTHYKITNITGGTLARLASGLPAVTNGQFLTIAQGTGGLLFFPAPNSNATGHFTVQASIGATDAGLGGGLVTADIVVDPVPDTPSITPTTTPEETQSTTGLVITKNAVDGPEITHFKILEIFSGTLFQHDGTTPILQNGVISAAEGAAGLKFTPAPNFSGTADFLVIGAFDAAGTYRGSPGINGGIVTVTAVADTPSITNTTTTVNAQTTSGLVVSRNAVDGVEVTHAKVTGITGGTLFQSDGTTAVGNGSFITMAQGAAGLRFTPLNNSLATGHLTIQASTSALEAGLGGALVTADIIVNPLASATAVTTSKTPANPGEAVTFSATVTPSQAAASGTVQFMDNVTPLGSPVAVVSGSASLTTSTLIPGTHAISAIYSGNTLALTSTGSLAGGQTVRSPVTIAFFSSASPAPLGSAVTVTASTVGGSGGATGTMAFKEGATPLATVTLSGGTAAFTTSAFTLGTHHLTVEYGGDAAFAPGSATFDQVTSCPVLTVGPATIPSAVLGIPYTVTFTQTGGVGATAFALTGALPAGLGFAAATATLSGVPVAPGSYPIQITATPANGCGAVTKSYTLLVGGGRTLLTGADAGVTPHVRRFTALDGSTPATGALNSFLAFEASFSGGVRVAEGDVNGDGVPDYIAGAGPGRSPDVDVYDGATGAVIANLLAFESDFRGGVFVAAGDVNGDGFADVIAGSGEGRSGEVKVYSGRDFSLLRDTFVFARAFTGGIHVAAGDVNGDGLADLLAGTGVGAADVTILNGADGAVLRTLTAYPGFTGGVWVAAGDVTGDGYADIVTGASAGGAPHVRVLNGRTGADVFGFMAFDPAFGGGARVAVGDVTGDGRAEIIVASGPGGSAAVRVFDGTTTALLNAFTAYPAAFTGGSFVATAAPLSRMSIDAPLAGSTIRGTFTVTGWALEEGGTGPGLAGIDVAALPAGGGAAIPLGSATLGGPRPDVAAIYGAQYATAGFQLAVNGLAPGTYDLRVTARGAVSGTANLVRIVRITIRPEPQPILAIDIPVAGRLSSGDFAVTGWALTPETLPAPGVDAIHVWAAPVGGGAWKFLGAATLGVPRPDVAIVFGSPYAAAGYYLGVTGLAPGTWDLQVFPRATGRAAFAAPQVVRVTVPGGSTRSILTGADAGGGPHVKRFAALDGGLPAAGALSSFFAFDPSFTGGVRVAEGDVTGDGVPDYIVGAGPGATPEVRIIDGALGAIRASFLAFEPAFRGGVFVAAADVNGDGFVDVIAGSGEGRRGEIKVFSGRDASLLRDVFVFDAAFRGGVHVAAADVNGDGYADLVAGSGAGGSDVLVLNATDLSTLWAVTPYAGFLGGAWVAAGDVTGDGFADVVTGAGAGGGPHVRVFNGRTGVEVTNFFAYEPEFAGGVRVAVGDVTGDGRAEIITGPGPGRAPEARVFDAATATLLSNVLAYPAGFTGGIFVATAVPVNRMAIDTPGDGATVHGTFYLAGWAFDEHPSTAGLDAIHVWAFPVAGGVPAFGGVAALGDARPDVAALYGAQYLNAGFHVNVAGLAPGVYDVVVFGHSSVSGTFNVQRVVRVTIAP